MNAAQRSGLSICWELFVIGGVAVTVGVGDYHIFIGGPFFAPRPVALGVAIFLGLWALVALRLRRV